MESGSVTGDHFEVADAIFVLYHHLLRTAHARKKDDKASAAIATLTAGIWAQERPRFGERVDVARIIIDARVLDVVK